LNRIQKKQNYKVYRGFSIVEALLAIALFAGTVTMMMTTLIYAQESNLAASNLNKAALLADEGLEAVKSIRNDNFTNITDGDYQLTVTDDFYSAYPGIYELNPGIETIGDFTREITIDSNALDTYHKRITVEVTYPNRSGARRQVQVQTIITDWQRVISSGTNTWITPIIIDEVNIGGNANLNHLIIDGNYLYALRSSGNEVVAFDISDPANITELDDLNLNSGPRTMIKQGDFLYIASAANSQEVIVVDVSNVNHLSRVYRKDLSRNNNNVDGIFYDNGTSYYIATRDYRRRSLPAHPSSNQQYTLYAYDNSNPNSLNLQSKYMQIGNRMHIRRSEIKDHYVFLGTSEPNKEIIIVDIADINNMTEVNSINLPNSDDITEMQIDGDTLFIGTKNGYAYIYSITDPLSPTLLSSITLFNKVQTLRKVGDFLLIAVEDGSVSQLESYDINDLSSPTYVSSTEIRSDIKDIKYDPINNLIYIGTTNNSRELVVIEPS